MDKDLEDMRRALDALEKRAGKAGPVEMPPKDDGLAKRYTSLPFQARTEIAERLGLSTPEERGLDERAHDRRVFMRLGFYGKERQLSEEIDRRAAGPDGG